MGRLASGSRLVKTPTFTIGAPLSTEDALFESKFSGEEERIEAGTRATKITGQYES